MKKLLVVCLSLLFAGTLLVIDADSKGKGEKCIGDAECDFGMSCSDGVCIKKREFDFGSSGKTGKPCNVDSDCIGSGSCKKNNSGRGYCTGN